MKFYKNFTKAILLCLSLVVLGLVSCKEDDKTPETVDSNPIVGKWQLTSVKPEVAGTNIPAIELIPVVGCAYSLVFTFESNNKVTPSGCDAATTILASADYLTVGQTTTWKVENGNLILTNGSTVKSLPLKQSATEITITVNTAASGPAVNALLVFKKI